MKKVLKFCRNPLFVAGVLIRLILIMLILPVPVDQWYVPFLSNSINALTLDPWQGWLDQGGAAIAFPYGYAMWLFLLPLVILCKALFIPLAYGYGLSLLAADFGLLLLLRKMLKAKDTMLLAIYWLSPISLIASYWLGYNDIIPVFILVLATYCIKEHRLGLSGVLLMTAISAKLSMILALPFFFVYLFNNRSLRQISLRFITGLAVGFGIFFLSFLWSRAGLSMIISNPEIDKIYQLSVSLVRNTAVYLVPLGYLLMLYAAWRVKRINFELFNAILGMVFLLVVLLTPSTLGWFIWILPLLVTYQASGDRAAIYLTSFFSVLYVMSVLLIVGTQQVNIFLQLLGFAKVQILNLHLDSLTHTALVATGIILGLRIWRETVTRNDFFRLSRKPFVIGVAGDSGAGKDTFVNAITTLFGTHSVAAISGDDYHLWDRHQPMWQVLTHINPTANDLESFARNLIALTDGRATQANHYDHDTGKMGRPFMIHSNDIIIASGLHALYLPILRECYDLSIYLNIDEELRTYFKIQRDTSKRGYSVNRVLDVLAKRKLDSEKFIKPQEAYADLIFNLRPINSSTLLSANDLNPPRLKLVVKSRHNFNELSLNRVLIGVCGLHVDMKANLDISEVELSIEGETTAQDIKMAAQLICPQIFEFLDLKPQWQNGMLGLMQLITLSHINQSLTRRFI
jgi:uridine kinase